ncbi:MAG: hypothetical protein M3O88_04940 [Actinomycetota bacterium]|nr:hypothetical protein [Actinomycetota bacterium]
MGESEFWYPSGNATARTEATTFAHENLPAATLATFGVDCPFRSVHVTLTVPVALFAGVFGGGPWIVTATPTAIWEPRGSVRLVA